MKILDKRWLANLHPDPKIKIRQLQAIAYVSFFTIIVLTASFLAVLFYGR